MLNKKMGCMENGKTNWIHFSGTFYFYFRENVLSHIYFISFKNYSKRCEIYALQKLLRYAKAETFSRKSTSAL